MCEQVSALVVFSNWEAGKFSVVSDTYCLTWQVLSFGEGNCRMSGEGNCRVSSEGELAILLKGRRIDIACI